jgi:hypothetical protein
MSLAKIAMVVMSLGLVAGVARATPPLESSVLLKSDAVKTESFRIESKKLESFDDIYGNRGYGLNLVRSCHRIDTALSSRMEHHQSKVMRKESARTVFKSTAELNKEFDTYHCKKVLKLSLFELDRILLELNKNPIMNDEIHILRNQADMLR